MTTEPFSRTDRYRPDCMKALLMPLSLGVTAARHLAWYVNYQVTGETRPAQSAVAPDSESPAA
jgi:hypothetical protein